MDIEGEKTWTPGTITDYVWCVEPVGSAVTYKKYDSGVKQQIRNEMADLEERLTPDLTLAGQVPSDKARLYVNSLMSNDLRQRKRDY